MLRALVRFLVALVVGGLLLPPVLSWVVTLVQARWTLPQDPWAVAVGAGLGLLMMLLWRPSWFWHTWVHEHCHLVACLVLFTKVRGLSATDGRGGAVDYDAVDALRGTLIAIAPYTLPLLLLPLLLAQELLPAGPWRQVATGLVALAFFTHLHGLWHNIRLNLTGSDSDLVRTGRPLAAVLIVLGLALTVALVLFALWGDPLMDGVALVATWVS